MKHRPLWVLIFACLYAGCVTRPQSEAEVVVSRIIRERPQSINCRPPEMSYCEIDVDGKKSCVCIDRYHLFGPH